MKITRMIGVAFGALILTFGVVLALASPANANPDSPVSIDRTNSPCGPVVLTTTQAKGFIVAYANGETVVSAAPGASVEVGPFDSPTTVQYRLFGGGERDWDYPLWTIHHSFGDLTNAEMITKINEYNLANGGDWAWATAGPGETAPFVTWDEFRVKGCVAPAEPTVTQYECATGDGLAGEVVITPTEGVRYLVHDQNGGQPIAETTVAVAAGEYQVTALAEDGYALTGGKDEILYPLTVNPVSGCPGDQGPEGPAGADGKDGEDGISGVAAGNGEQLPLTGASYLPWIGIGGAAAIVLGSLGLLLLRRRKPVRFTA